MVIVQSFELFNAQVNLNNSNVIGRSVLENFKIDLNTFQQRLWVKERWRYRIIGLMKHQRIHCSNWDSYIPSKLYFR